jgi:hypothetical protein
VENERLENLKMIKNKKVFEREEENNYSNVWDD